MWVWDSEKTYSGCRILRSKRHQIPDLDPQQCMIETSKENVLNDELMGGRGRGMVGTWDSILEQNLHKNSRFLRIAFKVAKSLRPRKKFFKRINMGIRTQNFMLNLWKYIKTGKVTFNLPNFFEHFLNQPLQQIWNQHCYATHPVLN